MTKHIDIQLAFLQKLGINHNDLQHEEAGFGIIEAHNLSLELLLFVI